MILVTIMMVEKQCMNNKHIIIFDGVCNLCNSSVNFIICRDPAAKFLFAPMQTELDESLLKQYYDDGTDIENIDTFLLIKNEQCFTKSDAALEIAKDLSSFWKLCVVFKIIPRTVRDIFYNLIARNRYAVFGKKDKCMIPSQELMSRFIGIQ